MSELARWNSSSNIRKCVLLLAVCVTGPLFVGPMLAAQQDQAKTAREIESQRVEIIRQATEACICVFSTDGKGGGSGVVVSADGYALTNYHVVKPCGSWMHCSMADGRIYDAVIVGIDPTGDVALIKLLGRDDFPVAEIGDSDQVQVGEFCFAIGNPFLLATNLEPSVSWGIVSGVNRYQYPSGTVLEYADCIQTDAAINPGNSGGPLFNGMGQLIGINGRGSFEKRGRVNVGVGYAISINQIRHFWNHLRSGRIVDHATLGATVGTDSQQNVIVDEILVASDAFRRGLRFGDQLVSFGGRSIETVNEFKNVLGTYPRGWRVPLEYRRDGDLNKIVVRLSGVHSDQELIEMVQGKAEGSPEPEIQPEKITPARKSKSLEVPEEARKRIEDRRGYANFYFNRLRQEEVWSAFTNKGQSVYSPKQWQITGKLEDDKTIQLVLADEKSGIKWGESAAVLNSDQDLAAQLMPNGTGGMLVTAHLWRRLLTRGPEKFGDVFYLGGLPTHQMVTAHVLTGRFDSVECRFLFDPESGLLMEIEMWSDPNSDPCTITFDGYRNSDGVNVQMPHRWTIRHGDNVEWVLSIDKFEWFGQEGGGE